ncbi:MAG: NUDIX hydrolase [candidate division KSB1 bacterium]|nr:NUDIX hydrolase [candidate division KSB1 bacterium]MDZ7336186.1 NUDIX hydrolase [candidate division KSB1 bacterium]MDZ7356947.1 NUDIX hydrolase [candidate division KSB1 bacterium]MDZ7375493.1 NUDIX hydrolase [candidate division KSB1 bacterium]MDZ7400098.1 NUDIX hydrolase [candidate division KSB1 bacterium]
MIQNLTELDVIQAAGGLLWRSTAHGNELAIIHRPKHDDWTLPKGKLEPGETWHEAALREVFEETGCQAEIENFAGCVCYVTNKVPKLVLYWNMKLIAPMPFRTNNEVDRLQWWSADAAVGKLTYPKERELVLKNVSLLPCY